SMAGHVGEQDLGIVPVYAENLAHEIGNALMAALEENQDRRTGAPERAAEQAWSPQLENVVEAGNQGDPVGLVEAILERDRESGDIAGCKSSDEERGSLHVEHGVLFGIGGGEDGTGMR